MDRYFEFPAFVTVRAERADQAKRVLTDALAEIANSIVNGDLGIDIAIDDGEPVETTEDADEPV